MVDKIGSKRTAERMDKWVELHTNNKPLYSSLMFTNRSLLLATYGSGFRVSAGLSLFLFIIIILSRLLFWLFFSFFRARARQGNLVPDPISHQSNIHHTFVRNESLQHQYIRFSSNRAGKKRAGRRRGKSYFVGGVEIIC